MREGESKWEDKEKSVVLVHNKGQEINHTGSGPENEGNMAEAKSGVGGHSKNHSSLIHILPSQTSAPVLVELWWVHQLMKK